MDEKNDGTKGQADDKADGNGAADQTPSPESGKLVVGGREYTPADVQRLIDAEKNFQSGYTAKFEVLAREREALEVSKSEVSELAESLRQKHAALVKDVEWYSQHDKDDWPSYESNWSKLSGSENVINPTISEMKKMIETLSVQVSELHSSSKKSQMETEVDAVIKVIDKATTDFPLAVDKAVIDAVNLHRRVTGEFPSVVQIREIAEGLHKSLEAKGVRVVKELPSITKDGLTKKDEPPAKRPVMPDTRNTRAVEAAFDAWLVSRGSA